MKPRFLLDEHVSSGVQRQLRRLEPQIEIIRIGSSLGPPIGTSDPVILEWIELNDYILVSENRRTMPGHLTEHLAKGKHFPGILLIKPGTNLGELVNELYLIWFASEATEYYDLLDYIPF